MVKTGVFDALPIIRRSPRGAKNGGGGHKKKLVDSAIILTKSDILRLAGQAIRNKIMLLVAARKRQFNKVT
jgi:hypothetical protein